jgi:DNA repair protein SbcD/Mre11
LGLRSTGADVVLIAGNHDNQASMQHLRPLLAEAGVTALGQVSPPSMGGVVKLETRGGEAVVIALVPFLSARHVVKAEALMELEAAELNATYDQRLRAIVAAMCTDFGDRSVNIVMTHLMIRGGRSGGGERDAHTIFDYSVDVAAFPNSAHYIALGHLHRFQQVGGSLPAYYSGAPFQVDFGEEDDEKGVVIVDVTERTPARVRFVPLTCGRRLRSLTGSLAELTELSGAVGEDLLRVTVCENRRPGLADEVRALLPNAVEVRVAPEVPAGMPVGASDARSGRSPRELFTQFLLERGYDTGSLLPMFDELHDEAVSAK